jgi:hypothetical protein
MMPLNARIRVRTIVDDLGWWVQPQPRCTDGSIVMLVSHDPVGASILLPITADIDVMNLVNTCSELTRYHWSITGEAGIRSARIEDGVP